MEHTRKDFVIGIVCGFILAFVGYNKIDDMSKSIPQFDKLEVDEGLVFSVNKISKGNSHLKLCLNNNYSCYKYGHHSWHNAENIIKEGIYVKLWYFKQEYPNVWQLEYNKRYLMSFKFVKWEIESKRKLFLAVWYFFGSIGVLATTYFLYKFLLSLRD